MPPPTSSDYLDQLRLSLLHLAPILDDDALEASAGVLALVAQLDLEPARAILQACYAANPRGGEPWDPVVLLRCLFVMIHTGEPSINRWVPALRASLVLRAACGLSLTGPTPGVGTFYDFLHRLHDGPRRVVPGEALPERPSLTERRRASAPVKPSEMPAPAEKPKKAKKKDKKKKRKGAKDNESVGGADGVNGAGSADGTDSAVEEKANETMTARIVKELEAAKDQKRPVDLLRRLSDLLLILAVKPSAERGLLGDTQRIITHGDGSALTTGADSHGRKTCEHDRFERCDCPRLWTDPDARWGYVASLNEYFFGHHFYEISVSSQGRDLPLALRLDPGNTSDFAQSLWTLDALQKQWAEEGLGWKIGTFIADAGHDAEPIYRYLVDHEITPVIPLRDLGPARHPGRPELTLSPRGVPMCEAGVEMAGWGTSGTNHASNFVCPFKARKLSCCPKAPESDPTWSCRPELKLGPTVTVASDDNPRIFSPLPRNHPEWARLMGMRSGCERSNAAKKKGLKLEQARHVRASFWLIRLHLIAIVQHARAWVASMRPKAWLRAFLDTGDPGLATAA
jgi:hypothetical protein